MLTFHHQAVDEVDWTLKTDTVRGLNEQQVQLSAPNSAKPPAREKAEISARAIPRTV